MPRQFSVPSLTLLCAIMCTFMVIAIQLSAQDRAVAPERVQAESLPGAEELPGRDRVADILGLADFLRLSRNDTGIATSLDTAIATYHSKDANRGVQIDLVGAVHVGDQEYYHKLNQVLAEYDVVLYELVAPKGTRVPRPGSQGSGTRSSNPISMLQGMTKDVLNLASQMEEVDYTKSNFVHADMSPQQMADAMKARGDTPLTVALSAMTEVMRQANLQAQQLTAEGGGGADRPLRDIDPLSMLFDPQRDVKLKELMAEQFALTGSDAMGPTMSRLLIDDRNAAAMKVLREELVKGHKRIAIFYGAAHLPDFDARLRSELGMKRTATAWLAAWDLQKPSRHAGQAADPLQSLLRSLLQRE